MTQTIASVLGAFVAGLEYQEIPKTAISVAKTGIIDTIAVMVAGKDEEPVRILQKTLVAQGGNAEATVCFGSARLGAADTAWVNGTAGHVLDYDDFARGHPSVVIVPAILAEGEALGSTGRDLLTAYVAGYETWMEVVTREKGNYQMKGWHPTPLIGALAAAAAVCRLRGLSADQTMSALGIAAAQASGVTASYGTHAKSMQVGKAAHTGIMSARLAANGMTAFDRSLDHEQGFLFAVSPKGDVDLSVPAGLGQRWHIVEKGLSIKRYPVCYCGHRIIDAACEVGAEHAPGADQIADVEVTISGIHATILKHHRPRTGLEAKFSAEFAVASALVAGNVGLQEVNDAFVNRADVQALMKKVRVTTNENYDPEAPGFSKADQVFVKLADGRRLESRPISHALGNAKRPLAPEDLRRKFLDCIATGDAGIDAEALFDTLQALENVKKCGELYTIRKSAQAA